jgi:hypothetical protein
MNWIQLSIGLSVLALGALIYFICRVPQRVYFISALSIPSSFLTALPKIDWPAESNLPAFAHVFAFILISASFVTQHKGGFARLTLLWLVLDFTIEFGQKYKSASLTLIPDGWRHVPLLSHAERYFLNGTFDAADLAATALGAAAAYGVLCLTARHQKKAKEP